MCGPRGLKPLFFVSGLAARLKPRPFKTESIPESYAALKGRSFTAIHTSLVIAGPSLWDFAQCFYFSRR